MGKIISFPTKRPEWVVRFKTPVRLRIGSLPFLVMFGAEISTAKVQADTIKQARYIVSQHLPVDEWLD
jgi:hypothetical protein